MRLALGDASGAVSQGDIEIRDTASVLSSFHVAAGGDFADATAAVYTAANWPGSNTRVSLTFSTTIARVHMLVDSFVFGMINHVEVEQQGGGPPPSDGHDLPLLGVGKGLLPFWPAWWRYQRMQEKRIRQAERDCLRRHAA
jgi:hypothetical protein